MLRRTPIRRTRKEWERIPREDRPMALSTLQPVARGTYAGGVSGARPKEPAPVRDESYRRWVASLPCYECRIQGFSQCAHPNSGKAKGKKLSDEGCFPMCCDRPGVVGCHTRFDRYEMVSRADMPGYEQRALEWTRDQFKTNQRT
jgi:hypothetical protein